MPRKRDPLWEHTTDEGGKIQCKFCQKAFTGSITRIKYHLAKVGQKDIQPCLHVPDYAYQEALAAIAQLNESHARSKKGKISACIKPSTDTLPVGDLASPPGATDSSLNSSMASGADKAEWNSFETNLYINLMLDEVKRGNMHGGNFNALAKKTIETEFVKRGGKAYTGVQFKNIFQRLKRKYSLFKRMISSTGFSWNSETQTVSASDLVWEGFLKGNKEAKQFRKGGLERYDDLRQIFGDNIANGGRAFASSQEVPPQRIVSDHSFALNMEAHDYGQSRFSPRTSRASSEDREHRQDNPPAGLYKRKNRADEFSDAVAALLESTALRKAQLAASSGFHLEDGDFSMVKAMDILNAMEELDEDQYVAASSRLDDPNWRQRFILTPSNKRLWLINALLRTSSRP